jgi:hypothetical protein
MVTLTTVRYVRATDGTQKVEIGLPEFQALLDAASIAEHGVPDVKEVIAALRVALASPESYVDADQLLAEFDATHGTR